MQSKKYSYETKIIFLSFYENTYSRSGVYFKQKSGRIRNEFHRIPTPTLAAVTTIRRIVKGVGDRDSIFFVMSPSHKIAIILRLFTSRRILLDAGWMLSESTFYREKGFFQILKNWAIDFLSFHMSDHVLLESQKQKNFCSKVLFCKKRKLSVVFTGCNELLFNRISPKEDLKAKKSKNKLNSVEVLFRGKNNQESGIYSVLGAAKLLENRNFHFTICTDFLPSDLINAKNVSVITEFLSWDELGKLYRQTDIAIGQISQSTRLSRTIPHKAFEAGYFGVPFISSDSLGIRELYPSITQVQYLSNPTVGELTKAILHLGLNSNIANEFSLEILERYQTVASQLILQNRVVDLVRSL